METTPEDATAVLDLCGTEGNIDKGILFLHMMYHCSDSEATLAVMKIRRESLMIVGETTMTRMSLRVVGSSHYRDRSMDTIEQVRLQAQGAKLSFDEHGDSVGPHHWPTWSRFMREFTQQRPGLVIRVHLEGLRYFFYYAGAVTSSQTDPEYNGCLHKEGDESWR